MKIYICLGISGSGKTLYADSWVSKDPSKRVKINAEGFLPIFKKEEVVKEALINTLKLAMSSEYDIILDGIENFTYIKLYYDLIVEWNKEHKDAIYSLEFVVFNPPVIECISRNILRGISEEETRKQWKLYGPIIVSQSLRLKNVLEQDHSLPHCILVDLDGTLALNYAGRSFYGVSDAMKDDVFNESLRPLLENKKLLIISSRDEDCREITEKWLSDNNVKFERLFLRNSIDTSLPAEYKKTAFKTLIKDNYYIEYVLDDDLECIKMFKGLGLTTLQV